MQLTPSSPNKKGKHFLNKTQPNNLPKAEKMPPSKQRRILKEPKLHKLADKLTEILIYFMVIFSPWAFGTTEPWSIWTMNISAYALGILLVSKWITRLATKYNPNPEPEKNELSPKQNRLRLIQKTCTILLAGSMFLLLAYILTSAINARASFNFDTNEYTYFEGVNKNLPHSYDARGTWFLFSQYLGLVILFWSTRDWFAGANLIKNSTSINPRFKRLLILLCLNGGALTLECILQRIHFGENYRGKLLFLVEPGINRGNLTQFGPFAYRSNAASYLNLIWPIGLGLLIQMGRESLEYGKKRIGNGPELLLIPCIILAASGPIISSTRGGALVMIGLLIVVGVSSLFIKVRSKFLRFSVSMALFVALGTAYYLGWEKIESRLINIFSDNMSSRTQLYETTLKMINDYGKFGSGPGSFEAIIQFEMGGILSQWESWTHNDYLEFYLTFGKAGGSLMCCILFFLTVSATLTLFLNQQKIVTWFGLTALLGVGIHAAGDFPLQTISILIPVCILSTLLTVSQKYEGNTASS
jgi:hypothetical protein